MSKFIFRPVPTIIAALNDPALLERRLALFAEGPVVIAVIDTSPSTDGAVADDYMVVTNFTEPKPLFKPQEWVDSCGVLGYVAGSYHDLTTAHNAAWVLFLNMTHTRFDVVVRRKAWHAFKAAEQSTRLFSDLGDDYYDHGVHPSTLDDEAWLEAMIRRCDDHLFNARFYADQAKRHCYLPDHIVAELREMTQGLLDQRPDNFDDNDEPIQRETHYVPNYVNDDGSFPAWDDPEHGLEARMSVDYERHYGAYA